jgi:serine/threonine protein kinase
MDATVESLCTALVKSRLLTPDGIRTLYQRWLREAKESAPDLARFSRWLVENQIASEYQLGVISRGRGDQLFLNQYKLIDRVGKGRMAGVYKAVHNLGQAVAIKVLPPSKARDAAIFARFQREARLAVRLKHPNIVRTFQMDAANGLHYLVMEYLEGDTLAELLSRRGALPAPEAVCIVYQALQGLQHLHEQGLVHRDISPANLMLVKGESDSLLKATVKILDIGTGRQLFDEEFTGGDEFALTNEGDILGTPMYMSPEQAGDPHGADIRADIYSAGCILYQTLAGVPPFQDKSNVRLLMRHATEAPRPIVERCPDAPAGLQRVLDRMLAKDRSKRFATPDEARLALTPFLAEEVSSDFGPQRPEFRAYLQWLDTQKREDDSPPPKSARPEPAAGVVPPELLEDLAKSVVSSLAPYGVKEAAESRKRAKKPEPAPARRPEPVVVVEEPVEPPEEPVKPSAPPPAPKRKPPERPPERVAEKRPQPKENVAPQEDPAVTMAEALPESAQAGLAPPSRSGGLNGRDLLMIGIGVGVVCILLLITVIVLLLVR